MPRDPASATTARRPSAASARAEASRRRRRATRGRGRRASASSASAAADSSSTTPARPMRLPPKRGHGRCVTRPTIRPARIAAMHDRRDRQALRLPMPRPPRPATIRFSRKVTKGSASPAPPRAANRSPGRRHRARGALQGCLRSRSVEHSGLGQVVAGDRLGGLAAHLDPAVQFLQGLRGRGW